MLQLKVSPKMPTEDKNHVTTTTTTTEEKPWQSSCGDLRQRIGEMHLQKLFTDCELVVGATEERIPVHRMMLAGASPVFASMLFGCLSKPLNEPVFLPDVEPETARLLVMYIYTDQIILESCEVACALYEAADYLLMPHLQTVCSTYLGYNVTLANVFKIYEFAQLFNECQIQAKCLEIMGEETAAVLEKVGARSQKLLEHFFSMSRLSITSELELCDAALHWMRQYCVQEGASEKEARELVQPAIQHIRFLALDPKEFASVDLSALLTQDQILAISLNLHTKDAHIPMPIGFSICRRQREPYSINTTITNLDTFEEIESDINYIDGRPWKVVYSLNDDGEFCTSIESLKFDASNWTLLTRLHLNISSHKDSVEDLDLIARHEFSEISPFYNGQELIPHLSWNHLKNATNGYVHNDSISVDVRIMIEV